MSLGLSVSKQELDGEMGNMAREFKRVLDQAITFNQFFAANNDAFFINLGYTQAEVTTMRAAIADLVQLQGISTGQQTLPTAKDFTTNARTFWGTGI